MLISRNEALERLREYRTVAQRGDTESAREMAIGVLLDIIDDEYIRFSFKMVTNFEDTLEPLPKILADDLSKGVQETAAFMERERRIEENEGRL